MVQIGARKGLDDGISSRYGLDSNWGALSSATGAANRAFWIPIKVLATATITGISLAVGAVQAGNVKVAVYREVEGEVIGIAGSISTVQATAETVQRIPFESTFESVPDEYWAAIVFSSTLATFMGAFTSNPTKAETRAEFNLPASFTLPTTPTNSRVPLLATY